MASMEDLKTELIEEVSTIFRSDFSIDVAKTRTVPHSNDAGITFPNLDSKSQSTKLLETCVLYVDMRRSTTLNFEHKEATVAKLYSAFVRAMTKCADHFGGHVRGIIGDRVMIIFEKENCFVNAVDTAILIHSVCEKIINKHFKNNDVKFGIGIDHGKMLATKTGIRKKGAALQNYRSLVWLGRPANIASKLTDIANKPKDSGTVTMLRVGYASGLGMQYVNEWPHNFVMNFSPNPTTGNMHHNNPNFRNFTSFQTEYVFSEETPPILMTEKVFLGFKTAAPTRAEIKNNWFREIPLDIANLNGKIYGGRVNYTIFNN